MDKNVYFYKRLTKHIHLVQKFGFYILERKFDMLTRYKIDKSKFIDNLLKHDYTKFNEPLKSLYVEISWMYKQKSEGKDYGINKDHNYKATVLHVALEPHHPEYWDEKFLINLSKKFNYENRDGLPEEPVIAYNMPNIYVLEMACDIMATALERGNHPTGWLDITVNKRWLFKDSQIELLYSAIDIYNEVKDNVCKLI